MTGKLSKDEKKGMEEKLNPTQIKWLKENKGRMSKEATESLIKEFEEIDNKNKEFWDKIQGGN